MPNISKVITVADTFSTPLNTKPFNHYLNVSVWGTFSATVILQRSFDEGITWLNVASYTSPKEDVIHEPEGALYRIGVETGNFTSGTINVRLGI